MGSIPTSGATWNKNWPLLLQAGVSRLSAFHKYAISQSAPARFVFSSLDADRDVGSEGLVLKNQALLFAVLSFYSVPFQI